MDEQSYLSGYTDGEGCFCVTFNKSRRHRFGWDIRPSFSVSQNRDRAEVLKLFERNFQCGTIRPDRSDKTLKYEVRSIAQLAASVIPHFTRYPLLSSKQEDFKMFAAIVQLMQSGDHLQEEGFAKIVQLAERLNKSGKKKYVRGQIKV
jgi:hypothetical protein